MRSEKVGGKSETSCPSRWSACRRLHGGLTYSYFNCEHGAGSVSTPTAHSNLFPIDMSSTSRWALSLSRTGSAVFRSRISTLPCRLHSRPSVATPWAPLVSTFSSSRIVLGKKGKKSNSKAEEVDDDATMVIRTKGKVSRKSATLASAAHSNTGSSRRGAAGEEPIESDVAAGDAHDDAVIEKAKVKMEKTVSWFKSVVFDGVERGKGRITPGKAC